MSAPRDFLIIVRAGAKSLHPSWVDLSRPRSFDLLVAAYSKDAPALHGEGITTLYVPGWKVKGFAQLFANSPQLLTDYRYIALIDDDIETDQDSLERCFALGEAASLRVWQPSLSWDSYFSHACVLTNPHFKRRYVNFVEMMCPFFEAEYLRKIGSLFELGYETGIDTVWSRFMKNSWLQAAVLDEVSVRHTRPVGMLKHHQGFGVDEAYDAKVAEVASLFGMRFGGGVAYAGVEHSGALTTNRAVLAYRALEIAPALRHTPMDRLTAGRLIAAFIRHTLTRMPKTGDFGELAPRLDRAMDDATVRSLR